MPEHERKLRRRQLAISNVQVGPADTTRRDGNPDVALTQLGAWKFPRLKRSLYLLQNQGMHGRHRT
jgi:hypothetical protein